MKPYEPPKAAEKIMNERTVKTSHEWRREKRRMRNLIRKTRPIADNPEIACWYLRRSDSQALLGTHDACGDLAKCLRPGSLKPCNEIRVDERLIRASERGGREAGSTVGADDEGGGLARRKAPRSHEDAVVGGTILGEVNQGRRCRGTCGDRDEARRRRRLASTGFGAIDIIDNGKIGGFGAVRQLTPHGRSSRIVGESDVKVGMPGHRSDLDGFACDRDAGMRAGKQSATHLHGDNHQRDNRVQDLKTQHDTPTLQARVTPGLWLAECKQNSLPAGWRGGGEG